MRTLVFALVLTASHAAAQTPPEPDTLVFANGEKLIGHLVRSTGANLTFKSDTLGEISVPWAKVKELRSTGKYAVLDKGVKLNRRSNPATIPQGAISVTDQVITVVPGPGVSAQTIAVANAAYVLDVPTFERNLLHNPGFFEAWRGAVTGGLSLVEATQSSRTFTGAISLIRAIPTENWLAPRNRTLVNFSAATGHVSQPNTPTLKTSIVHADLERDQYFRERPFYGFAQASFDHNYSQGLDLQQNYGGGLGYTVIKHPATTLDFKASVNYARQSFTIPANNKNLIGSIFGENFTHRFPHGILFVQQAAVIPSYNVSRAWSAAGTAALNLPVYKRFAFTLATLDTFLNDPPPGFKKNSFQLTTGLTYTLR